MNIGVALQRSITVSPVELKLVSEAAERLGYHSLWVTEHIVIPAQIRSRYPYSPDGRPPFVPETECPEAMVTLGFVAGITRRIRLGTSVIPMITRDPVSIAKQAATVDALSDGRLELGLGAGWLTEEAEVLGHPHAQRGARLDEAIDIMRKAWTMPRFRHDGHFWRIPEVGVHPHPRQGADVPIWIGGTSPAALRTTAERAVGNIVWLPEAEGVAEMRARLPHECRVAASMRLDFRGEGPAPRASALRDAGADLLLIVSGYRDAEATVADLERFAVEVVPAL